MGNSRHEAAVHHIGDKRPFLTIFQPYHQPGYLTGNSPILDLEPFKEYKWYSLAQNDKSLFSVYARVT